MGAFLSHFYQAAGLRSQFVLHWRYLDLFIQRCLCDQVFLINLWNWLGSEQRLDLNFVSSISPINIEFLALFLMVKVSFLLVLKGLSLLVDFSLSKDAWLDVNLSDRVQVYINRVISLLLFVLEISFLLFSFIHSVIQLSDDVGIQLFFDFGGLWSENPFCHSG